MTKIRGFKFATTLVLVLEKVDSEDKTKYNTLYWYSKAEKIINESEIDDNVFESIYTTEIIKTYKKILRNGLLGYWFSHRA